MRASHAQGANAKPSAENFHRMRLDFSTVISAIACVAILGFGLAPKMLVPIAWGTAIAYSALDTWAQRRFRQR